MIFTHVMANYLHFFLVLGILGTCDKDPNNDADGLIQNITQADLTQTIVKKQIIQEKDSLFHLLKQHNEKRSPTGAQYALLFQNTGASTIPLKQSVTENDLTIEIMFHPLKQGGTVISYAKRKTFAVTINVTLKLHLGKFVIDTGIAVKLRHWSQISIVWYFKDMIIQLYHFDEDRNVLRRRYSFVENPFLSGGILSLGQWELSPGDTEAQTKSVFHGIIDEVRIWKRLFNPVLIQQNIGMNVLQTDPGLSALWKLNEGEGNVARNLVNDEHFYLALSPWKQPLWIFSDAPVKQQYISNIQPFEVRFPSKSSEKEARSRCWKIFYETELFSLCKSLRAELDMYFMICLQNVAASGNLASSINVAITFADHCQAVLNLRIWPAKTLCNIVSNNDFPDWIGDRCETKCVFGIADQSHGIPCKCLSGFWGEECNNVCPGGIVHPCGGHGICERRTGVCSCDVNWNGNGNCSSCAIGWYGAKCQYSISSVRKNRSIAVASVFGTGYFYGFDGIGFSLETYGEFYITRSTIDNFAVQVRQSVCINGDSYHNLCTTGLAVQFRNVEIVLRAPITTVHDSRNAIHVWLNNKLIVVDHVTQLSAYFVLTRTSSVTYSIQGPNSIRFDLKVGQSLSFTCNIPRLYCLNASGLLGSCVLPGTSINGTDIDNRIQVRQQNSSVSYPDTLFVYKYEHFNEPRVLTGGGLSLVFTDSFVLSNPLNVQNIDVLTVELLVKVKMHGGVILSYSQDNTFALINYNTLVIKYRGYDYDTGIVLDIGYWHQISLVFIQSLGTVKIYVFDKNGAVTIRVLQLDKDIWKRNGILAFGQWISSKDNSQPPTSNFYGTIDEVRIWKRLSNPDLVKSTWRLNVHPTEYKDLLHLWKMNQVQGGVVYDLAGKNNLLLKKFHQPKWQFSDANVSLPDLSVLTTTGAFKEKAKSFCFSILLKGSLFDKCESLGKQIAEFYYLGCLRETGILMDINAAINSVVSFADYCQNALKLPTWPAKDLCDVFQKERFPYWIGEQCDVKCVFGYSVPSPNDTNKVDCKCESGYWGENCENLCPGGLFNVCNGHGTCNSINGTCTCEPQWTSDENAESSVLPCSKCSDGWSGADCDVAFTTNVSKAGMTIGFGDPHVTTITGVSYNIETPGAFLFLNTTQVHGLSLYSSFYSWICMSLCRLNCDGFYLLFIQRIHLFSGFHFFFFILCKYLISNYL